MNEGITSVFKINPNCVSSALENKNSNNFVTSPVSGLLDPRIGEVSNDLFRRRKPGLDVGERTRLCVIGEVLDKLLFKVSRRRTNCTTSSLTIILSGPGTGVWAIRKMNRLEIFQKDFRP